MVEVGLYGNIFEHDYDTTYGCLASDGMWWKNFWKIAHYLQIGFELPDEYQFQPSRGGFHGICSCRSGTCPFG